MDSDQAISELREVVRKLKATGQDGFEGLMAEVLSDITETAFVLASSGSQRGKDGQSAMNERSMSFEAKFYEDNVPRSELVHKVGEIGIDPRGNVDLSRWRRQLIGTDLSSRSSSKSGG